MKSINRLLGIIILAVFAFFACDNDTTSGEPSVPTVTSVTVSPAMPNVVKGNTQQFTATVTGNGNPAKTVTWSIEAEGKKPETDIDSNGKLTIASDEELKSLIVRATSTVTITISGIATVSITESGNGNEKKPYEIPADWKTLTYDEWELWVIDFMAFAEECIMSGTMTEEDLMLLQQEVFTFILENYDSLSDEGREFWSHMLPEDTHGMDIENWPNGDEYNGFNIGMYYLKSENGLAIAVNPMYRGDGTNSKPDIFILEEGTGGVFPIGTWKNRENETLTFTSTAVIFDSPYDYDMSYADYTMTSDTFELSNVNHSFPYIPTLEDESLLATFNEAEFRNSHPWVPATSDITPKTKKGRWFYNIKDNPDMTFVGNEYIVGIWSVCSYISMHANPNNWVPSSPPPSWLIVGDEEIEFFSDGTSKRRIEWNDFIWYDGFPWTSTTNTYAWSEISGSKIAGGLFLGGGDGAEEFVIKEFSGEQYLFKQHKSGDYSRGYKPGYYVYKKIID